MNEELSYDTKLSFYPSKIILLEDGRYLIISTESGNWIVLDNNCELEIFNKLENKTSIGDIIKFYGEDNEAAFELLQRVLAKIFAREFAGISSLPKLIRMEGFRMLNLYITNSCNLRCLHCFMNSGDPLTKELTTDEIKNIFNDFQKCGGTNVTITGGEPLMRKDFMELLRFSKNKGLSITVLTNGLLWKDETIEEASRLIDEIQISIDGVDDITNSRIRGKGHFKKALATAKKFAQLGVRLSIASTLDLSILDETIIPEYLEIKRDIESESQGEIIFKFSKKILPGRNGKLSIEENKRYAEKISQVEELVKPNAKLENFRLGHEPNVITRNCGIGGLSIRSDGHVFFCNRVYEVDDYGYIFDKPMSEWLAIGKNLNESTSVDSVEPCNSCYLKNICNGGCRIDDFNLKGRTKNLDSIWYQTSCTDQKKTELIQKMVKMFDHFYDFSQQ